MKECCTCKEWKPAADFCKDNFRKDKLSRRCRRCSALRSRTWRASNRLKARSYNRGTWAPGEPERAEAVRAVATRCEVCGTTEPGKMGWQCDHDHATGLFRGILCNHCNKAAGHLKDNPAVVDALAAYLRRHSALTAAGAQLILTNAATSALTRRMK